MRRHVLAAVGAAALLASASDVSAQQSNDGRNRWVNVTNNSSFTMMAVYAVPSRYRQAHIGGRDLIPNATIPSGTYLEVNFDLGDGECLLDVRARGSDGRDWIERRFDVCNNRNWNLRN
jgi:hypothetical protein